MLTKIIQFQDNSFEFILCGTVLQYIRYPFVMMREAFRVLKPHGKLIGTVAFLEPYNSVGFYNNTQLGALNVLQYGGFKVEKVSPNRSWSALTALVTKKNNETMRIRNFTGSFTFIATKEEAG